MENLAPITIDKDIPTKKYVDDRATVGFYAYSGRYAPAWQFTKAFPLISLADKWIYAYRFITNVATNRLAIENPGPQQGMALRAVVYSDASPWPGTKLGEIGLTTDLLGMNECALGIGKSTCWIAIHNVSGATVTIRGAVERNPYSIGSIDITGAKALASGIAYNVGNNTSPATWPAGTGTDADAIAFYLRAT